jgi:hypothetical protein
MILFKSIPKYGFIQYSPPPIRGRLGKKPAAEEGTSLFLDPEERLLVIRALQKVIETQPPYARFDEYKQLLDRLKGEEPEQPVEESPIDIDEV